MRKFFYDVDLDNEIVSIGTNGPLPIAGTIFDQEKSVVLRIESCFVFGLNDIGPDQAEETITNILTELEFENLPYLTFERFVSDDVFTTMNKQALVCSLEELKDNKVVVTEYGDYILYEVQFEY